MKVCFVLENFYPHIGGAETLFKGYTTGLAKAGCEVKVVTSNSGGVNGRVFYDGVEVNHFPWRGLFGHPVPYPKDLREFVEWSDVVHTATLTAGPVALSVSKEFNRPCIITIYEVLGNKWSWVERNILKSNLYRLFERYTITRDYSFYHAISTSTQNDLINAGIDQSLVTAIYPGVRGKDPGPGEHDNSPGGDSLEAANRTFLFFGRPGKLKGLFVLFEAIRSVKNQLPKDIRFEYILSNDPLGEKRRLRKLVKKHALEDLIAVTDPLPEDELVTAIKSAYCVVVPSITEGFGLSAAESCMLGTPVIASDAGSLPEVVFGKVLFFKNRDSDDLATRILQAIADKFEFIPERAFDWNTSTRQLLNVYEKLVKQRPGQNQV